ncbi:hypothetical protein [Rhizobium sp. BK176]|uniref:hypothetical protein n=1 Tax=Rhizobium sp. BK176 TaxID=2587071 RepID=UPI002168F4A4|nr:hypothetical protein [Rhizobium sp. BK176]MCS4089268.1 putative N-acetyltransferase YhbS [Rhizobium sp. BK176]
MKNVFTKTVFGVAVATFVGLTGAALYYAPIAYQKAQEASLTNAATSSHTNVQVLSLLSVVLSLTALSLTRRRAK